MVGILIAAHGGFAEGLLNAVELIAGEQTRLRPSDCITVTE